MPFHNRENIVLFKTFLQMSSYRTCFNIYCGDLYVSSYATMLIIYNVPNLVTDPFKDLSSQVRVIFLQITKMKLKRKLSDGGEI